MIKRFLKAIGTLGVYGLALSLIYFTNLFLMRPASIDHYLAKELILELTGSPEYMTYMGIFDQYNWLTKHNAKLSIPSSEDLEKDISNAKKKT